MADYSKHTDQELLVLLRTGSHAAFTQIYTRYWAVLFRHANRMLHDTEQAGDVVQDIFTMLWTKSADLEFKSSLSAFLYTSVRNKTIDLINRGRVAENYLASLEEYIEKGEFVTDDQIRHNEFSAIIEREIAQLPPKMREAFELSRKRNLSYKEIASEMNIADDTVKKQISKALKILRIRFGAAIIIITTVI